VVRHTSSAGVTAATRQCCSLDPTPPWSTPSRSHIAT